MIQYTGEIEMLFNILSGGRHINSQVNVMLSNGSVAVHIKPQTSVDETDVENIINGVYRRHLNFMPPERIKWYLNDSIVDTAIVGNKFMLKNTLKRNSGFTLIEIVVAVAVAGVIMAGIAGLMKAMMNYKYLNDSMRNIKAVEQAFETTYRENVRYIENNCYGWTSCTALSILPRAHATDNTKILIKTYSTNVLNTFQLAGCTVTGTAPDFEAVCSDGYGKYFTFTNFSNPHYLGTIYSQGYAHTPYAVTITSQANPDITETWSSGYLDSEYLSYSQKKIQTVIDALKSYHLSRLTHETTVNTCDSTNGGLASYDDVIIPWYFQATGTAPTQECTGIESGICGCSVFTDTAKWPTASSWNSADSSTEFATLFANLGLNTSYRVDGFGNPITIWFTVDSSGALQNPPPRPRPNYSSVWTIKPPYRGIVGVYSSGWVYATNVVYAQ